MKAMDTLLRILNTQETALKELAKDVQQLKAKVYELRCKE